METEKIGSTLKNYFNSNKEYKGHISNRNKHLSIATSIKDKTNYNENSKDRSNYEKKKNKSLIHKDSDDELSGAELKIKSKINEIKSAKIKKRDNKTIEEKKYSSKILSRLNNSPKGKNISKNQFNKNIKVTQLKKSDKKNYKLNNFVNSPQKNITPIEIKTNINKEKETKQNLNKVFQTQAKNNSPIRLEAINIDNFDFSNKNITKKTHKFDFLTNPNITELAKNNKINHEIITIDSNKNINNINSNINSPEEKENLNFAVLNKKILKTNKRLTELFTNSEERIDKMYQYVKKVFDHLSGIFYFKNLYHQKFSFEISPKSLMSMNDFTSTFPAERNKNTKFIIKGNNKYFSPLNTKTKNIYKNIVDKIEPYIIKKFKE